VTSLAIDSARLSVASARRIMWRHPEWWSVALSLAAWIAIFSTPRHAASHQSTAINLLFWLLMVVAMMFPLVMPQVRQAAFHSLWSRRHRAIALFLIGYVLPWLAFGAIVITLQGKLPSDRRASVIVAILIAAAWQGSPSKRRALNNCHRVMPLAPRGWRANRDCVMFGCRIGAACVCACWALMLVCTVSDHSILTMCVATMVAIYDRAALGSA